MLEKVSKIIGWVVLAAAAVISVLFFWPVSNDKEVEPNNGCPIAQKISDKEEIKKTINSNNLVFLNEEGKPQIPEVLYSYNNQETKDVVYIADVVGQKDWTVTVGLSKMRKAIKDELEAPYMNAESEEVQKLDKNISDIVEQKCQKFDYNTIKTNEIETVKIQVHDSIFGYVYDSIVNHVSDSLYAVLHARLDDSIAATSDSVHFFGASDLQSVSDNLEGKTGAEKIEAVGYVASLWNGFILYACEFLAILCLILVLMFGLGSIVADSIYSPKTLIKPLIIIVSLAIIVVISYNMSSGDVPQTVGLEKVNYFRFDASGNEIIYDDVHWADAGLYMIYICGGAALLALVYGAVSRLWK